MTRHADASLSLLRIVAGFLFFCAGAMKMFGWFGGMPPGVTLTPLLTTAGIIEVVCGVLILLGAFTRPAAFLASGEMAFAYFLSHFHFPDKLLPIHNHGEASVLFCFLFLFFAAYGGGSFGLDRTRARRRG